MRYWSCHWQYRYWKHEINPEDRPLKSCGSNSFTKRGVLKDDRIYVVSLSDGQLYLGGRMTVDGIVLRDEAVRRLKNSDLYDADEWAIGSEETGTPLNLHRRLSPEISRQLRFISADPAREALRFVSETHLDNQTTRGVRELTVQSAALLDSIIDGTDRVARSGHLITVMEDLLHGADVP